MSMSISRSRESLWIWLFWGLGIYLAMEFLPFLLAKLVLNMAAADLAGPFLAFAMPAIIFMPLVWCLWRWRARGIAPKRLARRWGASMAIFSIAVIAAVGYTGAKFGLMEPRDAVGGFVVLVLLSAPVSYLTIYYLALGRFPAQAIRK